MTPRKKVIVIGQGYVGLPVAMRAVAAGYQVTGIDLDLQRVNALRDGKSFVDDVSEGELISALTSQSYVATNEYQHAEAFDVAVITVPTPLKEGLPDLSFIEGSARSLAVHISRGSMVVLESTTYPGTTQELLVPILEAGSGLIAGDDFFVGYSPERIDPGNKEWTFANTPKVVSGVSRTSLTKVRDFYDTLVERTIPVSSPREAELTKLLENTFRHVNIALVNELAVYAHKLQINIWEAIDAAATKPFGYMKFTPGPGVGGHCLPVDPSYLSWQVRRELGQSFRFVELANDVNQHMPDYVIQRLISLLNKHRKSVNGSTVLLIGLAYKENTGDNREAPSHRLIELLLEYGANVVAVDDHVEDRNWPAGAHRLSLRSALARRPDAAILVTEHEDLDLTALAESDVPTLDTKNRMSGRFVERL